MKSVLERLLLESEDMMIAETGFSDRSMDRIDARDIGSFQSSNTGDDSYTCMPDKKNSCKARNCRQTSEHATESSEDDNVEETSASNQDQNRPLLLHRRNQCVKIRSRAAESSRLCRAFRIAACCLVAAGFMTGLASAVIYYVRALDSGFKTETRTRTKVVGCSRMSAEDVWVVGFPKLMTESAFRLLDINGDRVLDVLFGFATGF